MDILQLTGCPKDVPKKGNLCADLGHNNDPGKGKGGDDDEQN